MTSPKPSGKNKADLKPNGETFRLLFANHPIPMWIYDLETLAFLEVNDAALEKYGYTRDEFLTLTIKDIRPAEDIARLTKTLKQKRPKLNHAGEWRHCLKNGQVIDVEITTHILDFEGHKAALVMAQDITERKRAEEAMRESEDKFKYFFENSAVGKSITLLSDGMNANQALCNLLGYTQTELHNKKWQEITHPDDIELTQKEIDKLLSNEQNSVRFNKRFIHKNDSVVWVDLSSSLRRDKDGKPLYLMTSVIDITERKQVEDELKESEKRFATIFRANPAAIEMTRLDDDHLVDVNAAWQRMTGYVHTEVVGCTPQALNLWVNIEQRERLIEMADEQGKAHGEMQLRCKSGEVRDLLISADLIELTGKRYLLTMAQDITESKKAAEKLYESEEKYRAVVDKANDGIMIGQDGVMKFANSSFAAMLGYEVSEVEAAEFSKLLPPENMELLLKRYAERLAGKSVPSLYETALLHKNGGRISVEVNAGILQFEGKPADLIIMREITERKQSEALRQNFYNMLNASLNEIYIFDAQTLQFEFVSAGAINNLGYSLDELRRMTPLDLKPEITPETFATLIEPLRLGTVPVINFETFHRRANGSQYPVDVHLQFFSQSEHPVFMAVILDITERKQAEDMLRNSESLLAEAQRIGKLGHAEWIKDKDELICSNEMLRIFELPCDNRIISRNMIGEMVHPEDRKRLKEIDRKLFAERADLDYEYRILPLDNKTHWIQQHSQITYDKNGAPIRMIGVFQDITERKQMEEKLKESISLLRIAEEAAKLGGWSVDLETNRVTWSDEVAAIHETSAGFSPSLEEGISFYAPEWHERITKVFYDCAQRGIPYDEELEIISAKGKRVWVQTIGEAVRDDKGKIIKVHGAFQDISARKQTEKALRESAMKLARSQEIGKLGSWDWNIVGNLLEWSDEVYQIWGVGKDFNLTFENIAGMIHPDDQELNSKMVQEFLAQSSEGGFEFRIVCPDGTIKYIYQSIEVTRAPDGHPIKMFGIMQDITKRKQAEIALRESQAKLQSIMDYSPALISIKDLNGNVILANRGFAALDAPPLNELIGKNVFDIFPRETAEQLWNNDLAALQAKAPVRSEELVKHKNGNWHTYLTVKFPIYLQSDQPFGICAISNDITDRTQMEETLRETSQRLSHMLANSPTVIYALKAEGGKAIPNWISDNINAVLGFSAEDGLQPEWWTQQIHPEDRPDALASLEHLFDDFYQHEYRFLRKDGSLIWLHDEHRLLRGEDNKPREIIGAWTDITEHKQAEEILQGYNARLEDEVRTRTSELRDAQEKLVRNEKLAVLGQLAGGVGHELRNPLAVINNALYYLKLIGADSSEKVKEYLGIIQTEARTAEKIITDLLDFARIKSVDLEPLSASKLTARVLERYPVPKAVCLTLEIPEDLPKLYVDPRQMEQVLGNLVVNACQAMSTGGELTISAKPSTVNGQPSVAIAVRDTGVGISPENMKKLFEPLFTTKAKGIGLGLAVSQKLAEANGGRIEVESEAGVGSTFTVYLPVSRSS